MDIKELDKKTVEMIARSTMEYMASKNWKLMKIASTGLPGARGDIELFLKEYMRDVGFVEQKN